MELDCLGGRFSIDEGLVGAEPATLRRQVREYERGERRSFSVPVTIPETFTGRVLGELRAIPYGETRTYGEIAARLGTAPVAVGGACGRNPVPLLVPCHRVVGSDGGLRGFSAEGGTAIKRRLLDHERTVAGQDD